MSLAGVGVRVCLSSCHPILRAHLFQAVITAPLFITSLFFFYNYLFHPCTVSPFSPSLMSLLRAYPSPPLSITTPLVSDGCIASSSAQLSSSQAGSDSKLFRQEVSWEFASRSQPEAGFGFHTAAKQMEVLSIIVSLIALTLSGCCRF